MQNYQWAYNETCWLFVLVVYILIIIISYIVDRCYRGQSIRDLVDDCTDKAHQLTASSVSKSRKAQLLPASVANMILVDYGLLGNKRMRFKAFSELLYEHPALAVPAFNLRTAIRTKTMGEKWWAKKARDFHKQRSIEQAKQNSNLQAKLAKAAVRTQMKYVRPLLKQWTCSRSNLCF